jgi:hypothetical protein
MSLQLILVEDIENREGEEIGIDRLDTNMLYDLYIPLKDPGESGIRYFGITLSKIKALGNEIVRIMYVSPSINRIKNYN